MEVDNKLAVSGHAMLLWYSWTRGSFTLTLYVYDFLYFCNCISMLLGCSWTLRGLVPVGNVVGMFWGTWHSYNCWCSLAGLAKKVTEIQMGIQKYLMGYQGDFWDINRDRIN